MAEVIVQEESLVTIADAIRAKGGTTDALSFPTGFADAIAAIQAGGGGGGGVEGFTLRSGSFTLDTPATNSYQIDDPDGLSKRVLFFLFREAGVTERGITYVGIFNYKGNSSEYITFGGYVGGAGTNNNNLTYHSIKTNRSGYGETITITCSTTAPLSAHKYTWIELDRK